MTLPAVVRPRFRLTPMRPRDPQEKDRAASTLELFFDLVFVVAVGVASAQFHHSLTDGHVLSGLVAYGFVFFAIWWAWMNFTWFATSFATDDWLYRLLTIVQMAGVLVLAAGIEPAFTGHTHIVLVLGYVVIRVAMVAQWLRASRSAGVSRRATQFYAAGIAAVQVLWLGQLAMPAPFSGAATIVLILIEVSIPVFAERRGPTPWHARHITERYGLFTLIVLGESLLVSANAIIEAVDSGDALAPLIGVSVLTLIVTAGLWWIYFWPPHHTAIGTLGSSLRYGYVHYFVFASAAALSAGVEAEIDTMTGKSHLSDYQAALTISIPVAVFMLGIWWIALRRSADRVVNTAVPTAALLALLDALFPFSVLVTAAILIAVVSVLVVRPPRADASSTTA